MKDLEVEVEVKENERKKKRKRKNNKEMQVIQCLVVFRLQVELLFFC